MIGARDRLVQHRRQVVADGVRQHEVTVGQTLHECRRTETVRTVIGEVGLARGIQTGDGGLKFVVDPQSAHRVVRGRVDAHRHVIGVLAGDALVHLEEVAVALFDHVAAETIDRIAEVQVHAVLQRTNTATRVDRTLGRARRDVARGQVAVARIQTLEDVVALLLGNLGGRTIVVRVLRDPHATVVAQRLRHERELRLRGIALRNAGGVNLRVAGIREQRALAVRAPRGGHVAGHGVGGEEEHVAVSTGGHHHSVSGVRHHLTGHEVARDDAGATTFDRHHIDEFGAVEQTHVAQTNLASQLLIRTQQQLLTGLAAGVEGTAHLRATERTVVEQSAVLASERNTLGHHLVDDVHRDFGETMHVSFAGAEVAALDGVVEQTMNAVAVTLIVLGGVDSALRGDGVRAARRVVEGESVHLITEFGQRCRRRRAGQTGADDDDLELALVAGGNQLHVALVGVPRIGHGAGGDLGFECDRHVMVS